LRIILRDVLGLVQPAGTFVELSDVAEACLVFGAKLLASEQLTIIALGKFGGREISYGADLDVLFIGEDVRAAQNLMIAMAQPTAEGNIWALDARLRPEGEKGPVVCSLETYESYYASRAQLWEMQALTRARAIAGPLKNEFMELAKAAWRRACQDADLFMKIDDMVERIRRERGSGSDFLDLKTGTGGIIEAEFLVQALQMRANFWEQNWERAVDGLQQHGHLDKSDVAKLKNSYAFLRRCELVLRRYDNRSISTLPSDPDEERKFAIRLGYQELDAFRRDYLNVREAIHTLYQRLITPASPR
jgi:glutamate-ammonia-ligase adenylyltransferase